MSAFVIVEIEIHDHDSYEEYKKLTPGSLRAFEGKFVVRGGATETLEGSWNPERLVVLEFPTKEKAKAWWGSQEYAVAKGIRQRSANTKMLLVEGLGK